ncbi:uracil-DNA glycosylase family protein [Mycobacterium sp. ITM-2016-00317]|uniref:uracil-DNA glycosylase family protein n=1 Tax=Mycobacterium sp. ITM-2016-00317 TaxID=2099694 RepID=UPI000D4E9028|nr:uracil-DNA glycosylase family protein [Mycobacterium sp. ITM-2016-00317]WNG89225.1 uracil-DNA glycosylase family protein [Mycobacterium sp. ITM-2016-00317]
MTRQSLVAMKGSPASPVVIVGESLGSQKSRIPFDGGSGRLLDQALKEANRTKDEVFTTNVVDWHPTNDYRLTRQDIDEELPRLTAELDAIRPRLVICLGQVAATTVRPLYPEAPELPWPFTAPPTPITKDPALLYALHPSAALRRRNKLPREEREPYERGYVASLAQALRWSFESETEARNTWTETDVIAVDDLYREHGKLRAEHAEIQNLARRLGRTPTAVAAEMNNLHHAHSEPGVYPGNRWRFSALNRRVADR